MRLKRTIGVIIFASIILSLSAPVWGRSMVTGKVVDVQSGQPIAEAAVYIYWGKSGSGPPGLASGTVKVEVAEDLTDADGGFSIPKYWTWFKEYRMAVYKKGYVCWSSRKIFPSYEERKGFKLKNGMVIKLERFKKEYSRKKHALFTTASSINRPGLGIFYKAIESELDLLRESRRKNIKKKE